MNVFSNLILFRQNVHYTNCLFYQMSIVRTIHYANCPYRKRPQRNVRIRNIREMSDIGIEHPMKVSENPCHNRAAERCIKLVTRWLTSQP